MTHTISSWSKHNAVTAMAIVLTCGTGLLHGRWTYRWQPPPELAVASAQLKRLPMHFENWRTQSDVELSAAEIEMLNCSAHIKRVYVNTVTREVAELLVILGPPDTLLGHRPERCAEFQGFIIEQSPQPMAIEAAGLSHAFGSFICQTPGADRARMRVVYGLSNGGVWICPSSSRLQFAGVPYLYKIQVSCHFPLDSARSEAVDATGFLPAFLPIVQHHLVAQLGIRSAALPARPSAN